MITLEKLARLSARHTIKCAEEPRIPEIDNDYKAAPAMTAEIAEAMGDTRTTPAANPAANPLNFDTSKAWPSNAPLYTQGYKTPAWMTGEWKPESGKPNPYLAGMLEQDKLGPEVTTVANKVHGLDVRGQLLGAIERQQTEGGMGAGFAPDWQAQSPHPARMLQERGMTQGANMHEDYEGSPGKWMAQFMGPHAMPGTGETWVPKERVPFSGVGGPLRIGGNSDARHWANIFGREGIQNHELEHATRQHDIMKQLEDVGVTPLEIMLSGGQADPNWSAEQLEAVRKLQQSQAFGEIGPSTGDLVFRGEQFNRENPGEILYNKPIPPSEKNWVTGQPPPPQVEDSRPWHQRFNPFTGTEPPEQHHVPEGPPVPEHLQPGNITQQLEKMLDDPTQSPETKANLRRALEFAAAGRDGAAAREDELMIQLPGGVKMKLSNMMNMAAEHGYWGGSHPRYKMNEPWKKDDAVRPLSMHELMFKNIENNQTKQKFFEQMVRGEAKNTREEQKGDRWHFVGPESEGIQWKDMTPQQRAAYHSLFPESRIDKDDDRFERFDIDKQEWQDSYGAYQAEREAARDAQREKEMAELINERHDTK